MTAHVIHDNNLGLSGIRIPNDGLIVQYMVEILFPTESNIYIVAHQSALHNAFVVDVLFVPRPLVNSSRLDDYAKTINQIFQLS